MARAIVLLLVLLVSARARAGEHRRPIERLHLATSELVAQLGLPSVGEPRALATLGTLDQLAPRSIGLPPFFTLLAPQSPLPGERADGMMPLVAFGARVQGRTLVAFTRPGARVDPDDRVVYQRLVASDLFQGRRFSVTVYEDHALGSSASQILGFGARLRLRPTLEVRGWRARIELFASYDVTQGATGYIGVVGHPPAAPAPVPLP
jgi:hypothetical protein